MPLTTKEIECQLDFIGGVTAETLKQGHIFAIVITVDPHNLKDTNVLVTPLLNQESVVNALREIAEKMPKTKAILHQSNREN